MNRLPKLSRQIDYTIIPYDDTQIEIALKIAKSLRSKCLTVDCNFSMKKMKKSLQLSNETGSRNAILLFPDELSEDKVIVRDLNLHKQKTVKISDLISSIE